MSPSREEAVKSILYFLWRATRVHSRPRIILSGSFMSRCSMQHSRHYTWWCSVHRPWLCRWCRTFYTRLRKVAGRSQAFRRSSNHHGPAHFMGKDQIAEHWLRRRRTSCGCHGPVCLSGQHCWLDWLLQYRYPTTSWSHIFGDWSARPSLASEPAASCYEAEDLHYMCPGSIASTVPKPGLFWRKIHVGWWHSTWRAKDAFLAFDGMTS